MQSSRATEHSAGHVTQRFAVLAAGRNERRCMQTPLPGALLHPGSCVVLGDAPHSVTSFLSSHQERQS